MGSKTYKSAQAAIRDNEDIIVTPIYVLGVSHYNDTAISSRDRLEVVYTNRDADEVRYKGKDYEVVSRYYESGTNRVKAIFVGERANPVTSPKRPIPPQFRRRYCIGEGCDNIVTKGALCKDCRTKLDDQINKKNITMYSKTASKSYARDVSPRRSYKKNVLPPGVTDLTSSLLGSKVMSDASDLFTRGKKSKLARSLSKKNPYSYNNLAKMLRGKSRQQIEQIRNVYADKLYSEDFLERQRASKAVEEIDRILSRKKNPDDDDSILPEVEDLSKEWHGRGIKYYEDVQEVETYEKDLVHLGLLEELGVLELGLITFKKKQPVLACDGEGHNLEIIGGDQKLDLDKEGLEFNGKRLVPLGYLYSIVYVTDKHHLEGSNGYPEPYEHYFAEEFYKTALDPADFKETSTWFEELEDMGMVDKAAEEGRLPLAVYDSTDEKIIISGGGYEVTDLGIKD